MDQPHLSSQLDYLEQKHQESQATIARLQQRVETQEYVVQEQSNRIQQLEDELTQTNAKLGQSAQIDDQLAYLKSEILQIAEQRYGRGQTTASPAATGNLVTHQLESQTKAINEIRREVDKTGRYDEQIALARAETTRLNQEINKLQAALSKISQGFDERVRPLTYLEEQRRSNAQQLSELQAQLPDLHKKIEKALTKTNLVSQQIPQFAKYEVALDTMREEIRKYRENIDFQAAQRERQLKDYTGISENTDRRIKEIETSMEKYTEFYQLNKRSLASLQDFQERLQRDQHRFGELQRLAEDRQRTETEKFRADLEQRWKKQSVELEPQFIDLQKSMESVQKRLNQSTKLIENIETQLSMVLQIIEEDILARSQAITDWQQRFEQIAEEHA